MTDNPVDTLVKASGLSRRGFAKRYGVGEQVLLRLSQGRFTKVPQSIVDALVAAHGDELAGLLEGFESADVDEAYRKWREAQPVGELPTEDDLRAQPRSLSPAQALAAASGSMSRLAKLLHVHDYVVRRYVNGETKELPASMRASMEKLGWPHTDQLDRAQQRWVERKR